MIRAAAHLVEHLAMDHCGHAFTRRHWASRTVARPPRRVA
jgi:hypothetical protein